MGAEAPKTVTLVDSQEVDIAKTLSAVTKYLADKHSDESAERKESKNRATQRRAMIYKYVIPALVVIAGGGTFGGVQLSGQGAQQEAAEREHDVRQIDMLDANQQKLQQDVRKLGKRSIAQDVQMVEGIRFLERKLNAMDPDSADAVEKPDALQAAEDRVDEIKSEKAIDDLFGADPMEGME